VPDACIAFAKSAAQIKYFNIPVEERQLQRKIKEYTKGGGRYVMAYIEKVFSEKN
jgi:hypothetical protein